VHIQRGEESALKPIGGGFTVKKQKKIKSIVKLKVKMGVPSKNNLRTIEKT